MMLDGENSVQIVDRTKRRKGERKGRKASYRLWCFSELLRYALGKREKRKKFRALWRKKPNTSRCNEEKKSTHFRTL